MFNIPRYIRSIISRHDQYKVLNTIKKECCGCDYSEMKDAKLFMNYKNHLNAEERKELITHVEDT